MEMETLKTPIRAFIDVETSGLDYTKHAVYQVACIVVDETGKELGTWSKLFIPPAGTEFSAGAVEINGYDLERIKAETTLDYGQAHAEFTEFLSQFVNRYDKTDKLNFVAYNAPFDSEFVRSWFSSAGDNFFGAYFWNPAMCVMQKAAWAFPEARPKFPNFKLGTLCKLTGLGWEDDEGHDALYDIRKTIELSNFIDATF